MKYRCGVNIISHRFEWQSSGGGGSLFRRHCAVRIINVRTALMIEYNL